jgi:NADH dehydrogenase
MSDTFDVVTGAFGYTGGAIARQLFVSGRRVRTLTNHPDRDSPLASKIEIAPLAFSSVNNLRRYLEGAEILYNTYWVRFEHGDETFARAVEHSQMLVAAAAAAGVRRIVHISISNPSETSPLPYFCGKARVEQAIRESRLSYAILRPTVIFGSGGILINNIAWFLRKFPVFALPSGGESRLQPVFLDDVAELATSLARKTRMLSLTRLVPNNSHSKNWCAQSQKV